MRSSIQWRFGIALGLIVSLLGIGAVQAASRMQAAGLHPATRAFNSSFGQPGNIVIADQFNNRVIEVDPLTHGIVWQFGNGSNVPGPNSIVGLNDAERVGPYTFLAGTGVPPANPPFEPGCINGCVDNRVIVVSQSGAIVWQYGQAGVTGFGFDQLNVPVQVTFLPNGHALITDQGNERVIEVNFFKQIVWQYGMNGVIGSGKNQLSNPNAALLLANGHILISDENNNRVIEVDRNHDIVWSYGNPKNTKILNGAAFASRLPDGHTLITDSNNNRIVEIDANKHVVWTFATNARRGSIANPLPTRAVRLRDGTTTLISDQFNNQVIAVKRVLPSGGPIVFTQGKIGANGAGNGFDRLNAPYDAKVNWDFTGLTPPWGFSSSDAVVPFLRP